MAPKPSVADTLTCRRLTEDLNSDLFDLGVHCRDGPEDTQAVYLVSKAEEAARLPPEPPKMTFREGGENVMRKL